MQAEMNVCPLSTRLTDSTYLWLPVLMEKDGGQDEGWKEETV